MEDSAKTSVAEEVIEVVDPFQDFLNTTFLPQTSSGSGDSESLPQRSQKTKKRRSATVLPKPTTDLREKIQIPPIFDSEQERNISIDDPFQHFLQRRFQTQSIIGQQSEYSSAGSSSTPQAVKKQCLSSGVYASLDIPSGIAVPPLSDDNEESNYENNELSGAEDDRESASFMDFSEMNFSGPYEHLDYNEQFTKATTSSEMLYPGANISQFQANSMLASWFALHPGISKTAFDRLLYLLHTHLLPKGNILPQNYGEVKRILQSLLTPAKEYHCCINDCIIFRDSESVKNAALQKCPKCDEPRYQSGSDKIPRKRFVHLPLETRLRRMFGQKETARLFQQHLPCQEDTTQTDVVSTIHETTIWKRWYNKDGIYDGDQRGISFGICTDGVNPFAAEKVNYSMWPIVLFPLNFPAQIRKLSSSMMLVGIIPGPKEMQNIDPYLDVVVDDIAMLNGVEMYDAFNTCMFKVKATIVLNVLDYPGQNKVFHCQGAGAYAGCVYCCQLGEHCKALSKMVYLQHRRFLPVGDPLRLDTTNFPHKEVCCEHAPELKTQRYIDHANDVYKSLQTAKARSTMAQTTGCTGPYALQSLQHHNRPLNTPVEPMHLIKCISEHVVRLISGGEDSINVRNEEKVRLRFQCSWPVEVQVGVGSKISLPPAPFRLSKSEMKVANKRAVSIRTPHGTDWKSQVLFSEKTRMKSIQWKLVVSSGVLKYCIRGLLGSFQRKTLIELCDVLSELLAEEIKVSQIDQLEYRTHRVLALIEHDFPVSLNVIVFHLLHHLPLFLKRFGPAYTFWMFPLERFNSWIGRRVHNRRYPEATVIETYRLFEFSSFLSLAKLLPRDSVLDLGSNAALENEVDQLDGNKEMRLDDEKFESLVQFYQNKESERCSNDSQSALASNVSVTEYSDDPKNIVIYQNYLLKIDNHGRHVRYSPYSPLSQHSSCIVYMFNPVAKQVVFGEIKMTFKHNFRVKTNFLVYVHWFEKFYKDKSTNLIFVNLLESASLNPIANIADLSKPLIHAYEDEKLWILNAPLSETYQLTCTSC